jgi:periplasmic protein TonB
MFALIESVPARRGGQEWAGRAISVAIHAALLTAGVAFTRQVARVARPPLFELPNLPWPQRSTPPVSSGCACPVPPIELPGRIALSDPVVPPDLPPVQAPGPTWDPRASADPGSPPLGFPPGSQLTSGAPFDARLVDEPPVMLSHPELRYPEILRRAGLEGRAIVEAVLDTTGRAEPGAVSVVSASNPLFGDEARQVVLGARFRPGRVAGRAVRVRIRVPVAFNIDR